ncbi:hypothetical protein GCM10009839_56240 [Catenulispora yoronensis]|uniref:Uncharacterized protein n=1 Tax=Catenulispora yoronensis TaxID=450799 RepID=A0ABN2UWI6_9ACTN
MDFPPLPQAAAPASTASAAAPAAARRAVVRGVFRVGRDGRWFTGTSLNRGHRSPEGMHRAGSGQTPVAPNV